jgi:hypothetical protein
MLDSEERPVSQCDHATIGSEMTPARNPARESSFSMARREKERLAAETLGEVGDARGEEASGFKLVASKTRPRGSRGFRRSNRWSASPPASFCEALKFTSQLALCGVSIGFRSTKKFSLGS